MVGRKGAELMAVVVVVVSLINMGNSQEFDRSNESGTFSVNHVPTCEPGPAGFHLCMQPHWRIHTMHRQDLTGCTAAQKALHSWKFGHRPCLHLSAAWSDTWNTNDNHVASDAEKWPRSDGKRTS